MNMERVEPLRLQGDVGDSEQVQVNNIMALASDSGRGDITIYYE